MKMDTKPHYATPCLSLQGLVFAPRELGFVYPTSIIGPITDIQLVSLCAGLLCFLSGETVCLYSYHISQWLVHGSYLIYSKLKKIS